MLKEVVDNGYKNDLCLHCGREDECKHSDYSVLKIVDDKLEHIRHKQMDSPLRRDHMLALVRNSDGLDNPALYTKYDLVSGSFVPKTKAEIRDYMLAEIKKYKNVAKDQLLRENPDLRARLKERKTLLDNLEN